ncbi:HAD-IA family hydrolase [Candidatus Pelagibacter sp.]|nr:HAD-IA family hydrolase [Candidatus Pelagibacter sp.]
MTKYKALLFGSIGTIVETSEIQRKSFNRAFKIADLKWNWTIEIYKKLLNKSGGEERILRYAKKTKSKVNSKNIIKLKTKIFNSYLKKNKLKLRSGVKEIIKYCKKQEIKLALVSSTSKNNINSIFFCLRDSLNKKDFDFIGNSKLVKKLKPSPEIYKLALKELRLKPKECIAIEDTQESLNSAVKAKLKCFIFPGNFHRSKKFNGAFKEVSKINKNIFKS